MKLRRRAHKSTALAAGSFALKPPRRRRRGSKAPSGSGRLRSPGGRSRPGGTTPSLRWTLASEPPGRTDEAAPALGVGSLMMPPQMRQPPKRDRVAEPATEETPTDITEQIRALETRLDRMIRHAQAADEDEESPPSIREQVGTAAQQVVERLAAPLPDLERPGRDDGGVVDAAREVFSSDYYLRQWGRIGMRSRSEEVDEFGFDPSYERRCSPFVEFLYKRYFRVETDGIDQVPHDGRCLIVANHSGTIPLDGVMLRAALSKEHPSARVLRWLAEDYLYYLPFAGSFMTRMGAVRACQENAERLLAQQNVVAAFPEGLKGIGKLFKERYRLQRFGRGGFIRLCLRTQTPIVPCAIVGAEETGPMLHRVEYLGRLLGLPYIPITPTFPLFGPLGLVPAPTKWRIIFGEPFSFESYGREAADDHVLVGRLTERVRATIQRMLDEAVGSRTSVWLG